MPKWPMLASAIFLAGLMVFPPSHGFSLQSISDSLLEFSSGLFSNTGMFIKNKTDAFWNSLSEKDIFNLGGVNIKKLLDDRESHRIPERAREALRQVYRRNLTDEEIKIKLKTTGGNLLQYETLMYLKRLPLLSSWNKQNVTDMFKSLEMAPESLMLQVTDKEALNDIKTRIQGINENMERNLFRKMNGKADTWTNETFKNLNLKALPAESWNYIRPEVLASRKAEIINEVPYLNDPNLKETCLMRILDLEDLKAKEDPQIAMSIANSTKVLMNLLMPEDFNEKVLDNEEISKLLDKNIKTLAPKMMLSADGSKRVIVKFGKMDNVTLQNIKSEEDIVQLGLVFPNNLTTSLGSAGLAIDSANVNKILKGARNLPGLGAKEKAEILVSTIIDASDLTSHINVQSYDEEIWPMFPGLVLENLGEGAWAEVLKKNADFTKPQILIMLNKVNKNALGSLSAKAREHIPIGKMVGFDVNNYNEICRTLPPGSVVTMKFADSALTGVKEITPDNLRDLEKLLPFIGKKEAMLFNETRIFDILKEIKDINPPLSACITLKDKIVNLTRSLNRDFDENKPISYLLDKDFAELPLCVLSSYGTYALSSLKADQSILMLSRLGKAQNIELSIPRDVRMAIIEEGLAKMGVRAGLEYGDLEVVGKAIADISARELRNADEGIAYDFIKKMNTLIENNNGRKPCLDSGQMSAITEMIKKLKGSKPSSWYNIQDICCLMFTLPRSDLQEIDDGLILTCSCDSPNPSPSERMIDDLCQTSLGSSSNLMLDGEMVFKEEQMKASVNVLAEINSELREDRMNSRRKRETMQAEDVCNKASLGGAAAFTISEIRELKAEVVFSCIAHFGASNMTQDKAEELAGKVRQVKNDFKLMKNKDLLALGFIIKGFSSGEYTNFPSFKREEFTETVEMLGKMKGFSSSQTKKLANKIKDEWVSPAAMTASEIIMVNNILCGYESADISALPKEALMGLISVLSDLECSRETLEDLTKVVKQNYGDINSWGRGEVAELGSLIGGLTPEELMKIPPESMEGLTKAGIQKITPDGIKAMSLKQLSYLNPLASLSVSAEQKAVMTPQMKEALKQTTVDTSSRSGSDSVFHVSMSIVLPLISFMFYADRP